MNVSLFRSWNPSDGMMKYIPNGHVLKPAEYFITSNDEILVCNFFKQSVVRNVTHTESFFEYSKAQTIVSIVGSLLSLIAVILTFLTYALFASLRNRASRLIMNLIGAIFLGQFLLLFGGNENENACTTIAVLAHYAWLAAFAWMNALAFDLNRTFGNTDNLQKVNEGMSMFLYMIYAWGSPFLIVIPCLVLHFCQCTQVNFKYGSVSACWISDGTANLLTFGVPAAIFLLFNAILFGHTVAGIRSTKRATARLHQDTSTLKRTTKELLIYIKIASLMGFTWIFGYVAAFTGIEALWYIFIILNSLQGVFIFISFICNRRVGLLWSEKLKLSGPKAAQKSSTSGKTYRHRAAYAPGTRMTGYCSSMQSDLQQDGSDQPLKEEMKV
ncbi:latrophilin receptor-like protein A [Amphiura filiformis]|uniref:latrophilin receptor-like protein A n=1 Tax=Amphiura filiformis TaxID=82378 RepID=UPI003B211B1C